MKNSKTKKSTAIALIFFVLSNSISTTFADNSVTNGDLYSATNYSSDQGSTFTEKFTNLFFGGKDETKSQRVGGVANVVGEGNVDFERFKNQKISFLLEGVNESGAIKRERDYKFLDFINSSTRTNATNGQNGEFGGLSLYTPGIGSVAEYIPSEFQWNVPYKAYKIQNGSASNEGLDLTKGKEGDICMHALVTSPGEQFDESVKLDIYGLSEDGRDLIGKDVAFDKHYEEGKAISGVIDFFKSKANNRNDGKAYYTSSGSDVERYANISYSEKSDNDGNSINGDGAFTDKRVSEMGKIGWNLETGGNAGSDIKLNTMSQAPFNEGGSSVGEFSLFSTDIKSGGESDAISKRFTIFQRKSGNSDYQKVMTIGDFADLLAKNPKSGVERNPFESEVIKFYTQSVISALSKMEGDVQKLLIKKTILGKLSRYSIRYDLFAASHPEIDLKKCETGNESDEDIVKGFFCRSGVSVYTISEASNLPSCQEGGKSCFDTRIVSGEGNSEKIRNTPYPIAGSVSILPGFAPYDISTGRYNSGNFLRDGNGGDKIDMIAALLNGNVRPIMPTIPLDQTSQTGSILNTTVQALPVIGIRGNDSIINKLKLSSAESQKDILIDLLKLEELYNSAVLGSTLNFTLHQDGYELQRGIDSKNIGDNPGLDYLVSDAYSSKKLRNPRFQITFESENPFAVDFAKKKYRASGSYSGWVFPYIFNDEVGPKNSTASESERYKQRYFESAPFSDGSPYFVKNIVRTGNGDTDTNSSDKLISKNPGVFPLSIISSKENRKGRFGPGTPFSSIEQGKGHDLVSVCLSDKEMGSFFEAIPESSVYTKIVEGSDGKYLVKYKSFAIQNKFALDLSFGHDSHIFAATPKVGRITQTIPMVSTPKLTATGKNGDIIEAENFLSISTNPASIGFSVWGSSGNKDLKGLGFRVFIPSGVNTVKYVEKGFGNTSVDKGISHQTEKEEFKILNGQEGFASIESDGSATQGKTIFTLGAGSSKGGFVENSKSLYLSPKCPNGYSLYDNLEGFYEYLYGKNGASTLRMINGINGQKITPYFNTPRPFCVISELALSTPSTIVEKLNGMFYENNPFVYPKDPGLYALSSSYVKTLRSLFVGDDLKMPVYEMVSTSNNSETPDSIDFGSDFKSLDEKLFEGKMQSTFCQGSSDGANCIRAKQRIKSITGKFSIDPIFGLRMFGADNGKFFPVVGARLEIIGNSSKCKDGFFLGGKCFDASGNRNGNTVSNGALANWTVAFPYFSPGASFPFNSGNMYEETSVFDTTYTLKPKNASLNQAYTSDSSMKDYLTKNGIAKRAGGWYFPYRFITEGSAERISSSSFSTLPLNARTTDTPISDIAKIEESGTGRISENDPPFFTIGADGMDSARWSGIKVPTILSGSGKFSETFPGLEDNDEQDNLSPEANSDAIGTYLGGSPVARMARISAGDPSISVDISDVAGGDVNSGLFGFFTVGNKNGGLGQNSVDYSISGHFIDQRCLNKNLGDNDLRIDCSSPYDVRFNSEDSGYFIPKNTANRTIGVTANDKPTPIKPGDNIKRMRAIDGYSVGNSLEDGISNIRAISEDNAAGIGASIENTSSGTQRVFGIDYEGMLSRNNYRIKTDTVGGAGIRNSFIFNGDVKSGQSNSTNFTSVYSDDLVILTNGTQQKNIVTQGGYINGVANGTVESSNGAVTLPYIFSDSDNPNGTGVVLGVNSNLETESQGERAIRRQKIKSEVAKSAGSGTGIQTTAGEGIRYLAFEVPAESFQSLHGVVRLAKNSKKYFTNFKIHDPETGKLLSETDPRFTIYSWNNLAVKYGSKISTWGDNDKSCNSIDPNAVFNRIDTYEGEGESREDTITFCLSPNGSADNFSKPNALSQSLYFIVPIKPTGAYNKGVEGTGSVFDIGLNVALTSPVMIGRGQKDTSLSESTGIPSPLETYYQGYFTPKYNASIEKGFSESDFSVGPWVIRPKNEESISFMGPESLGMRGSVYFPKGRFMTNSNSYSSYFMTPMRQFPYYSVSANYGTRKATVESMNFQANKLTINKFPQVFINGFGVKKPDSGQPVNVSIKTYIMGGLDGYSVSAYDETNQNSVSCARCYELNEVQSKWNTILSEQSASISMVSQDKIKVLSTPVDSKLFEIPSVVKYPVLPIPEPTDAEKSGITHSFVIKDTFKKTGNVHRAGGILGTSDNSVEGSLSENGYNVSIGDIVSFEHVITASENGRIGQQAYLETQLDRSLDIDPDSLKIEISSTNGTRTIRSNRVVPNSLSGTIKERYGAEYSIGNYEERGSIKKTTDPRGGEYVKSGQTITVTKGVLYVKPSFDSGSGRISATTGIVTWNPTTQGSSTQIEKLLDNGMTDKSDIRDVFLSKPQYILSGSVLIIPAGERVMFRDNAAIVIQDYQQIPNGLLSYGFDKVMRDDSGLMGFPEITGSDLSSGVGYRVSPTKEQPTYSFPCPSDGAVRTVFEQGGTLVNYSPNSAKCTVFVKYPDYAYRGWINKLSPFSNLTLPGMILPFAYGDEGGYEARTLGDHAVIRNKDGSETPLGRPDRGYTEADRARLLIVNLGTLTGGTKVRVSYDAKVNSFADIGHGIYPSDLRIKDSENTAFNRFDRIIAGTAYEKNPGIYSQSREASVFFLDHVGKRYDLSRKSLEIENDERSQNQDSLMTVTPDMDISFINISGRKTSYACDPETWSIGRCERVDSLETLNSEFSPGALKEPTGILVKGQKFIIRATVFNRFYDPTSMENAVKSMGVNLKYNKNDVLFDGVILEKIRGKPDYANMSSVFPKLPFLSVTKPSGYSIQDQPENKEFSVRRISEQGLSQIKYPLSNGAVKAWNSGDAISVEFSFTARTTKTASEIRESFGDAFIGDDSTLIAVSLEFEKMKSVEKKQSTWPNNVNTAFSNSKFEDSGTGSTYVRSNALIGGSSFVFAYFPLTENYQFLEKRITDLSPSLATLNARIVSKTGNQISGAGSLSDQWLELEVTNVSQSVATLAPSTVSFSLPAGFSVDQGDNSIEYIRIDSNNSFTNKLTKEAIPGSTSRLNLERDIGRTVASFANVSKMMTPGERVLYRFKLSVNMNEAELLSTFSANVTVSQNSNTATITSETSTNILDTPDYTTRSIPLLANNDAYVGGGYLANTVNDDSYIEENTGSGAFNVIGMSGAEISYTGSKIRTATLDGSLGSSIFDLDEIKNNKNRDYSILVNEGPFRDVGDHFVMDENPEFKNNTLYFLTKPLVIGDASQSVKTVTGIIKDNEEWAMAGGVTVITPGTITINDDFSLPKPEGQTASKDIPIISFVGHSTIVNPRVTHLDGFYINPTRVNGFVQGSSTESGIQPSKDLGVFRTGYSNDSLTVNGAIIAGRIVTERRPGEKIGDGIGHSENIVEHIKFDFDIYINPPPILRTIR